GAAVSTRACPACGKTYAADYADTFCVCGGELVVSAPAEPGTAAPANAAVGPTRPPAGTRCLVLYGADRKPVHYFPLTKDVTLIGRLDPVAGSLSDIFGRPFVGGTNPRKH